MALCGQLIASELVATFEIWGAGGAVEDALDVLSRSYVARGFDSRSRPDAADVVLTGTRRGPSRAHGRVQPHDATEDATTSGTPVISRTSGNTRRGDGVPLSPADTQLVPGSGTPQRFLMVCELEVDDVDAAIASLAGRAAAPEAAELMELDPMPTITVWEVLEP
jgi:hypothetical protein